jgi:hypothetical protein
MSTSYSDIQNNLSTNDGANDIVNNIQGLLFNDKTDNAQKGGFFWGKNTQFANDPNDDKALLAARTKQYDTLKFLIDNEMIKNYGARDSDGSTLLHYLSIDYELNSNNPHIVNKIINCNYIKKIINIQNNIGDTPLIVAIKSNHNQLANLLANAGADMSIKNKEGLFVGSATSENSPQFPNINNIMPTIPQNIQANKNINNLLNMLSNLNNHPIHRNHFDHASDRSRNTMPLNLPNTSANNQEYMNTSTEMFLNDLVTKFQSGGSKSDKVIDEGFSFLNTENELTEISSFPFNSQQTGGKLEHIYDIDAGNTINIGNTLTGGELDNVYNIDAGNTLTNVDYSSLNLNSHIGGGETIKYLSLGLDSILKTDIGTVNNSETDNFLSNLVDRYVDSNTGQSGGRRTTGIRLGNRKLNSYSDNAYTDKSLMALFKNQSSDIHDRVVQKIMEIMKVEIQDAKAYKASIYKTVKEDNPELKNLDRAIEMEKRTTEKLLKKINLTQIKKEIQIAVDKKNKERDENKGKKNEENIVKTVKKTEKKTEKIKKKMTVNNSGISDNSLSATSDSDFSQNKSYFSATSLSQNMDFSIHSDISQINEASSQKSLSATSVTSVFNNQQSSNNKSSQFSPLSPVHSNNTYTDLSATSTDNF